MRWLTNLPQFGSTIKEETDTTVSVSGLNARTHSRQQYSMPSWTFFPKKSTLGKMLCNALQNSFHHAAWSTPPAYPRGTKSVWAQYSLLAKNPESRINILESLKKAGIPTAIYYPKPLHLQTAFAGLGYKEGDFPISEDTSNRIFSLPMHPYLTEKEQAGITAVLIQEN